MGTFPCSFSLSTSFIYHNLEQTHLQRIFQHQRAVTRECYSVWHSQCYLSPGTAGTRWLGISFPEPERFFGVYPTDLCVSPTSSF